MRGLSMVAALTVAGTAVGGGGGSLPRGNEPVALNPANFTTRIDNPFMPMRPGEKRIYRETGDEGTIRIVVTVTGRTRVIDGVRARVVHDVASRSGRVVEDTYDWFAQDRRGNVWYLGERTKSYGPSGKVSTSGSWEAGRDGAQAGVAMPAHPRVGQHYRQEYYAGQAEDRGRILSVNEQVESPYGHFRGAVLTKDTTPLEPGLVEYKLYARGVGDVLEVAVSGGRDRAELVRYVKAR
jgi:hypothetical protein